MTHTETIGSKGGDINVLSFQSISTTAAISEGDIIELNSSGNAQACATNASIKVVGVCVSGKPATTSAEQRYLSVQTSGIVKLYGWVDATSGYTDDIVPGERLMVGQNDDTTYVGQLVVHASTGASAAQDDFNTHLRKPIGIALNGLVTTETRTAINVLLTL